MAPPSLPTVKHTGFVPLLLPYPLALSAETDEFPRPMNPAGEEEALAKAAQRTRSGWDRTLDCGLGLSLYLSGLPACVSEVPQGKGKMQQRGDRASFIACTSLSLSAPPSTG